MLGVRARALSGRRAIALAGAAVALAASTTACLPADPRAIGRDMLAQRGWSLQYDCLDALWTRESNWQVTATNPSSGAYGIPQSLPADKMTVAGADWRTSAATQITWGLDYIGQRYGGPCNAWYHEQTYGWY